MICTYLPKRSTNLNNIFFSNLKKNTLTLKHCGKFNDYETITENYVSFVAFINKIQFPYFKTDTMTTLKMCIINSIFLHYNHIRMNLLIISDEIHAIEKSICLPNINIKRFPKIYDIDTLSSFILSCNHSIILVTNPTKKDIMHLNNLLDRKIHMNLNIVLWVLIEP